VVGFCGAGGPNIPQHSAMPKNGMDTSDPLYPVQQEKVWRTYY